jgi:formylglycine-generating enzyme
MSFGVFLLRKGGKMKRTIQIVCLGAIVAVLGTPAMAVDIETVPVGNVGNARNPTGHGAVAYQYNIGKYEVTAGQYAEFLNAVADTDTYGLYSSSMVGNSDGCQITQNGASGNFTYDFSGRPSGTEADWADRPVNYVSWGDSARFANWLHNGQPTGGQDLTTTEDGAYYLNGATSDADLMGVRESDWKWAIPSPGEWYKAGYHKNDGVLGDYWNYPTSNNSTPSNDLDSGGNSATFYIYDGDYTIGSPYYRTKVGEHKNSESPYGTFDQGGNVWEWNESSMSGVFRRGVWGGSFSTTGDWLRAGSGVPLLDSTRETSSLGFRVVQVPEPATMAILVFGGIAVLRRRRKQ